MSEAWITVREASSETRLGEERIRELIRQRRIRATKLGRWLIRPEDLQRFLHSRTNTEQSHHDPQGT